MKNQYEDRTDRKLRYAKLHLYELTNYQDSGSGDDFERAHCEAFLFQLIGARDTFLQEINMAHLLGISEKSVKLNTIKSKLEKQNITSEAFSKLSSQQDSDGWLKSVIQMRNAVTHRLEFNRVFHEDRTEIIFVINGKKQTTGRNYLEDLKEWYDNMSKLLTKLRSLLPNHTF